MISPSIGRVVWFHPQSGNPDCGAIVPAIVCKVWSDTCVNLAAFDSNGVPFNRTSVYLWQGDCDRPKEDYAEWMPYQIAQAQATNTQPPTATT